MPSPVHRRRWWRLLCLGTMVGAATATLCWWKWRPQPEWSDNRPQQGAIYSMASGKIPGTGDVAVAAGFLQLDDSGYSRVVACYQATSGKILWEHRLKGFHRLEHLMVHVAIDRHGGLIVASHAPAANHATAAVIEKMSLKSGKPIWSRELPLSIIGSPQRVSNVPIHPPAIDHRGNLWLTAGHTPPNPPNSTLLVLEGHTGSTLARHELSTPTKAGKNPDRWNIWGNEIHCLDSGGAVVFTGGKTGHHVFRFSETGSLLWQQSRQNPSADSYYQVTRHFVDETHHRCMTLTECRGAYCGPASSTGPPKHHAHINARNLHDGSPRWETLCEVERSDTWGGHIPGLARLNRSGDLELRHHQRTTTQPFSWKRWLRRITMPWSQTNHVGRTGVQRIQLAVTTFDHDNGSAVKKAIRTEDTSWFPTQANEASSHTRERFVLGTGHQHIEAYQYECLRCIDARAWFREGSPDDKTRCYRIIQTPGGRRIYSRDPVEGFRDRERLHHWQVMAR